MSLPLLLAAIVGLLTGPTIAVYGFEWGHRRRARRICAEQGHEWRDYGCAFICARCNTPASE